MRTSDPDLPAILRNPVDTIAIFPRKGKLCPIGRKMYRVMLYMSQDTLRQMGTMPLATHRFRATLPEILTLAGAEGQNASAKTYLTAMNDTKVVYDSPDAKSELQHEQYHLLSEVQLRLQGGVNWVYWSLPPTIYEALLDPSRWGLTDLRMLSRMTTYASVALYEIISKYKDNPSKLTCRKAPEWWMEVLSGSPPSMDEEGKPKLPEWRKFKNKFLNPAMQAINDDSDLKVELLEDRLYGKAVTSVQFKVTKKPSAKAANELPPLSEALHAYAKELGLTGNASDAGRLKRLARDYGDAKMLAAFKKLEARMSQRELDFVHKPVGMMESFLLAMTKQEDEQRQQREREQNQATEDDGVEGYGSEAERQADQAQAIALQRRTERYEAWVKAKRDEIAEKIQQMSSEEAQYWLDAYRSNLKARGLLTGAVERKLAQPDWFSGAATRIGMIEFYAKTELGDGWKSLFILEDTGD